MQFKVMLLLSATVLLYLHQVSATCNVCNNAHACTGTAEFQLCFNGERDTTQTYTCPNENQICVSGGLICVDPTSAIPPLTASCTGDTICGNCENVPSGSWACTSRTTFTMCYNNNLTEVRGSCPPDQLCDPETAAAIGGLPCVSECITRGKEICDRNDPIDVPVEPETTTTEDTTTTDTTTLTPPIDPEDPPTPPTTTTTTTTTPPVDPVMAVCSTKTAAGRYPLNNDTVCRSYVQCFWSGGALTGRQYTCPTNLYFNGVSTLCESARPAGCV